jgi:CDP-glucose 4,6-dehydratase
MGELNSNSFKETDPLGGRDPYSASKAAAEIITESLYISCNPTNKPVSSIRAGNVIGGGDTGPYRLIPDILRSIENNEVLDIRNLNATRPFQYITDAISGYLLSAQAHLSDKNTYEFTSYNIGPSKSISVEQVLQIFSEYFKMSISTNSDKPKFFETSRLSLNADHAKNKLGWQLKYSPEEAVRMTAEWYQGIKAGTDLEELISKTLSENLL